jgi:hypothetical protein
MSLQRADHSSIGVLTIVCVKAQKKTFYTYNENVGDVRLEKKENKNN